MQGSDTDEEVATEGKPFNGRISHNSGVNGENGDQATKDVGLGDEASDLRETQCGLSNWRPSFLQPFATIWAFTATISAYTVFGNTSFTYYSAVITQIERRYVVPLCFELSYLSTSNLLL